MRDWISCYFLDATKLALLQNICFWETICRDDNSTSNVIKLNLFFWKLFSLLSKLISSAENIQLVSIKLSKLKHLFKQ